MFLPSKNNTILHVLDHLGKSCVKHTLKMAKYYTLGKVTFSFIKIAALFDTIHRTIIDKCHWVKSIKFIPIFAYDHWIS